MRNYIKITKMISKYIISKSKPYYVHYKKNYDMSLVTYIVFSYIKKIITGLTCNGL